MHQSSLHSWVSRNLMKVIENKSHTSWLLTLLKELCVAMLFITYMVNNDVGGNVWTPLVDWLWCRTCLTCENFVVGLMFVYKLDAIMRKQDQWINHLILCRKTTERPYLNIVRKNVLFTSLQVVLRDIHPIWDQRERSDWKARRQRVSTSVHWCSIS